MQTQEVERLLKKAKEVRVFVDLGFFSGCATVKASKASVSRLLSRKNPYLEIVADYMPGTRVLFIGVNR